MPGLTRVTRPTRPSGVTTGSLTRTPSIRARRDDDRLRERAGRAADHLGSDRVEVGREARAVDVVEQLAQVCVLLERELALDRALAKVAHLRPQLLGLGACREEAVGPRVGVTERLRDALEAHRERAERGRSRRLDAAHRTGLVRSGTRAR